MLGMCKYQICVMGCGGRRKVELSVAPEHLSSSALLVLHCTFPRICGYLVTATLPQSLLQSLLGEQL
jgi:hypothetical protein